MYYVYMYIKDKAKLSEINILLKCLCITYLEHTRLYVENVSWIKIAVLRAKMAKHFKRQSVCIKLSFIVILLCLMHRKQNNSIIGNIVLPPKAERKSEGIVSIYCKIRSLLEGLVFPILASWKRGENLSSRTY